jgi:hypothetical protein
MIAWALFTNPVPLSANGLALWLVLPLCAAVAIVYRTIRVEDLRRLWRGVAELMIYMTMGLVALGVGLWAISRFLF